MSWKLSTLAIALLGLAGSSVAAGGESAPGKDARPQNNAPAVVSGDASPSAQAQPTDKELIQQQKTCPVSDQPLGSMGKPVKLVYKGRIVFLCCAGCKKTFLADPDKYLKKLDKNK